MQSTRIIDLQVAEIQDRLDCSPYEAWRANLTFARVLDGAVDTTDGEQSQPRCTTRQLRRVLALGSDSSHDWARALAVAKVRVRQREKAWLSLAAAHGCDLPLSTREWLANL